MAGDVRFTAIWDRGAYVETTQRRRRAQGERRSPSAVFRVERIATVAPVTAPLPGGPKKNIVS